MQRLFSQKHGSIRWSKKSFRTITKKSLKAASTSETAKKRSQSLLLWSILSKEGELVIKKMLTPKKT